MGIATGPTAWLSPLYPYLLALIFKLFGVYSPASALVAMLLNACASAATCAITGLIAWRLFRDDVAAIASAAVFAIAPQFILLSGYIWDTTLTGLLASACILTLLILRESYSTRLALVAGALGGLLFLSNAASTLFLPVCAILALWQRRAGRMHRIAIVLGTMFLISVPWVVRNRIVMGKFEPRCCFGIELKLGNNDHVWNQHRTSFIPAEHPTNEVQERSLYQRLGESRYDSLSLASAITYINNDHWRFLILCERRIRDYWFGTFDWTEGLNESRSLAAWFATALNVIAMSAILFNTLIGIAGLSIAMARFRRRPAFWILTAFLVIYPIPMYVASVNLRLQYPTEIIMVVFEGYFLSRVWKVASRQRTKAVVELHLQRPCWCVKRPPRITRQCDKFAACNLEAQGGRGCNCF